MLKLNFTRRIAALVAAGYLAIGCAAVAGAAGLYPPGDAFCFSFYSTSPADSRYALTNGATAIGPFYGDQAVALANAVRWNTKILYKVQPPCMAGIRTPDFDKPGFVWPSDATISNEVAAIVNEVKTSPHIAMWDIAPEELRSWKPEQLHYLKLVAAVIHANDPLQRPAYMYECNNRGAGSLATALACEDVCVKGNYVNAIDDGVFTHHRIWARWSMDQELGAVARGNPSAAPWIVLWMAGDPAPADFDLIPAWCRHDAYLGLIMGGKGVFVWSAARKRAGFSERGFQAYFDGYLSVARDLNGPLNLAPVFLFGKKNPATAMTITAGPKQLELIYQKTTNSYPPVSYLSTSLAGTNYLFMVNSAEEPVTATFSGLPAANREDLFAGGSAPTLGGSFSITMPALGVKAFQFAGENKMDKKSAARTVQTAALKQD
jgi:hypothetical protein